MPLRVHCPPKQISPGLIIRPYWPGGVFLAASIDVYLVCGQDVESVHAGIDTRSDYVVFGSTVAQQLGLTLPFSRQAVVSSGAGTQAGVFSFPPDGLVSLFVTDYTEYCYLPSPLIAFHPPSPSPHLQRSVLGLTGFLQHFRFVLDYAPPQPVFELHPVPNFPGQSGLLPRGVSLPDFILGLKTP